MSVQERADVSDVWIIPHTDNDGGLAYFVGRGGVTAIKIVARHGPLDWLAYIEVWKGEHLHAEVPQHQTLCVEFLPAASADTRRMAETALAGSGRSPSGAVPKGDAQ